MAADATESTLLLSKLKSDDLTNIHNLFSTYLHPFTAVLTPKTPPNPSDLRSLAKKFLPFLNATLSLLPKRLSSSSPKPSPDSARQLFDIYKLSLDCLDSVSSQLSAKPYSIHIQRVRLVHCYENWSLSGDALAECLSLLESLKSVTKTAKSKVKIVPDVGKESVEKELALLVVEVVVTIVKCTSSGHSKEESHYQRILVMIAEIQSWFRIIDANEHEKLHRVLVTHLSKCTFFLIGELSNFDRNLVCEFCLMTFREFANSSIKDQMDKFAHRICGTVFMQQDNQSSSTVEIIICVLDSMASECKVIYPGVEKSMLEYLELVHYCANKCRTTRKHVCGTIASHLAGDFCQVNTPFDLIKKLYTIGLFASDPLHSKAANDLPGVLSWLDEERHQSLNVMLGLLKQHCDVGTKEIDMAFSVEFKKSVSQKHLRAKPKCKDSICTLDRRTYMWSYYRALNFLCEPLSEFVNSEKKEILAGLQNHLISSKLTSIQDAFHSFCDVFTYCYRSSDRESDINDDTSKTVLTVAVATFTLSLTTQRNVKESINFLRHVTSADWIQANGLKFLFASLYNVGVVLYRSNRLKEASKTLKLCCKAAWTRVSHLCKMFVEKTDGCHSDLSDDGIECFVGEACSKSTFLLDVLHQCGSNKTDRFIADCLESWSVAECLFNSLPRPIGLVKQWVKIKCKLSKVVNAEHSATTLYSLLSSSEKVPKQILGILLEQELQAYKEMNTLNPEFCKKMEASVISVLLEKVYISKDSRLQKSRIFIAKGRASRACGVEGLNDSIRWLSEAISTLNDLYGETSGGSGQVCHQLAEAYCLRALCTQEAEPNSKGLIKDIANALKNWLNSDYTPVTEQNQMSENTLILLYFLADLLSMKGCMEFHSDIYEIAIRLFKWKNIPFQKWLTTLWQSRRLGHALCASPVSETFIMTLSKHYCEAGKDSLCEVSKSMEFWISCMKRSQSLQVGFQQKFSFMFNIFSSAPACHHDCAIQSDITIEEVKQAASDLISMVPLSSSSVFLASYLYYDLAERLTSNGLLTEAFSYSKEAHRLRSKLFQETFTYSIERQSEIVDVNGETIQKSCYSLKTFHMHSSVATAAWSYNDTSDLEGCILTPWSVLQCYLESTMQIGTIHELVGNGSEAETLLLWGKNISSFQGSPLFLVAFSSVLGKLYLKQRLWDLAEKELDSAKQLLADNCSLFSCLKCGLVFEVTVHQQLGDLYRSRFHSDTGMNTDEILSYAENMYKLGLSKLNLSEWKNSISNPEKASSGNTGLPNSMITRSKRLATQRRGKSALNAAEIRCEVTSACNKMDCWHCLVLEVMKSGLLGDFMLMKWEFVRRRLLLKLSTGIGKCFGARGEIHKAHEILLESISLFVSKFTFQAAKSSIPFTFLIEFIGKDVLGDVLAVEHASILYNICWFTLQSFPGKGTRDNCCDIACIPIEKIVSWLRLAFIRCHEVPVLFQKVSRLLAVIYALSTSIESFSMSLSSGNGISESQWASYFHQASLGCHLNHQLFSRIIGKHKVRNPMDVEGSCISSLTSLNSLRPAPQLLQDLEGFVLKFFQGLPHVTVVCISLLGDPYASLLRELLLYPFPVHAWILLSRLNANGQPLVIFLPVYSILDDGSEDDQSSSSKMCCEGQHSVRQWRCPWGYTVVDDVAPVFKKILEENYLTSSAYPLEDTKENRAFWWMRRKGLDKRLGQFLQDLEESWFGPWKYFLLGERSDCKHLDALQQKLAADLKSKCRVDTDEGILKCIIGGAKYASQSEECLSNLILKKGCYAGGVECCSNESLGKRAGKCNQVESSSPSIGKLILETISDVEEEDDYSREPIILVLDFEVQMLPWENLPVLRNQEVYRMPSVSSIFSTLDRCCRRQEKNKKDSSVFPLIDPLDAYYLLNPSGDLSRTESEFGNWFTDQNLEGKAGSPATMAELTAALSSHDLFIYFGHGSGVQYIPGHEIRKLERCAATFLMGCSSGSISLNGDYTPHGAPLYYLLAGSPAIVANLWEVTDKDIDRFGKAMLDAWLKERSDASMSCAQCSDLIDKTAAININGIKGNAKKKASKKKVAKTTDVNTCTCKHRRKIGSFMGQAREACTLPYLIGASPVCYGVPTGIRKKES